MSIGYYVFDEAERPSSELPSTISAGLLVTLVGYEPINHKTYKRIAAGAH
ncbi:MAG: hypothetical protein ACFFER_08770 [Candidatus Thorarchaeota archaeon]